MRPDLWCRTRVLSHSAHEAMGAGSAPGIPCALSFRGNIEREKLGHVSCRENVQACPNLERHHCAKRVFATPGIDCSCRLIVVTGCYRTWMLDGPIRAEKLREDSDWRPTGG